MKAVLTKILSKFASVSFRQAIEQLRGEDTCTIDKSVLNDLWAYFSSFTTTVKTDIVKEDMKNFVELIFPENCENITKSFTHQNKSTDIVLQKDVLIAIINETRD